MKTLFSADWHLKLTTKNIPDAWAINRYRIMFREIHELEKKVDLHVLGGDVFDRLPTMQELELYFEFIAGCTVETIIFAGNHEALKKNTTFLTNLKDVTNRVNPLVRIIDNFETIHGMDFIPYNKLKEYYPQDVDFHSKILFTHVRGEIPPHVKPEVDLKLFERWDLVFAGDLHSHSNSQLNIVYPGSPVTTSFHRNEVKTGVIILDSETLDWEWVELQVPQLLRKTIQVGDPMPASEYHHTIYEIEGDMSDLHLVEESDLIDKKISKRSNDVTLILSNNMTMQEELNEYLQYVLQVPDETIEKVMAEFNDNVSKLELG